MAKIKSENKNSNDPIPIIQENVLGVVLRLDKAFPSIQDIIIAYAIKTFSIIGSSTLMNGVPITINIEITLIGSTKQISFMHGFSIRL